MFAGLTPLIGYIPQSVYVRDDTIARNAAFGMMLMIRPTSKDHGRFNELCARTMTGLEFSWQPRND
jgi:hypothetical protein